MTNIRNITSDKFWDYENGYWWFGDVSRLAKTLSHAELYKKIVGLPGTVAEFGVYKAASFIRWLSMRELLESPSSRKIIGFDAFGAFPSNDLSNVASDSEFVERFEQKGGDGLSQSEVEAILTLKGFGNYSLVAGDIRKTLPGYLTENSAERFSLLHLDMDVYEPTFFVMESLFDRLVPGGLIVIDDYNAVEGATVAVDQFLAKRPSLKLEKLSLNCIPSFIQK